MFDNLSWQQDRVVLNDIVFRVGHCLNENWNLGENCFIFYKTKQLVDQYEKFWIAKKNFHPSNVLELGLWDGGSMAFWFEYFYPDKHVGVDITLKEDSSYFKNYVNSKDLGKRIKTYWGINQADSKKLLEIVEDEFSAPLDLVIDDASHLYEPTKTSFETLFPLLRPGGFYVIEDWAWDHWQDFQTLDHPWAKETEPTKLIFELIEAAGSTTTLIASLSIFQGFVVVERGEANLAKLGEFKLEDYISRRSKTLSFQKH